MTGCSTTSSSSVLPLSRLPVLKTKLMSTFTSSPLGQSAVYLDSSFSPSAFLCHRLVKRRICISDHKLLFLYSLSRYPSKNNFSSSLKNRACRSHHFLCAETTSNLSTLSSPGLQVSPEESQSTGTMFNDGRCKTRNSASHHAAALCASLSRDSLLFSSMHGTV